MIKDIEGRMVVIHDDTERDNFLFIMEDEGYKWLEGEYPTEFEPCIDYPYVIMPTDSILMYKDLDLYTYSDDTHIDYSNIFRLEIYKSNVSDKVILTYNKSGILIRDKVVCDNELTIMDNVWGIWDKLKFKKIDSFTLDNDGSLNLYKNKYNQLLLTNNYESVMISDNGIEKNNGNLDDWTPLKNLILKSK